MASRTIDRRGYLLPLIENLLDLWSDESKLSLAERIYRCEGCGLVIDRDLNAALNLAAYGRRIVAAGIAETVNGRGDGRLQGDEAVARCPSVKQSGRHQEAGSDRHRGVRFKLTHYRNRPRARAFLSVSGRCLSVSGVMASAPRRRLFDERVGIRDLENRRDWRFVFGDRRRTVLR